MKTVLGGNPSRAHTPTRVSLFTAGGHFCTNIQMCTCEHTSCHTDVSTQEFVENNANADIHKVAQTQRCGFG